MNRFTEFTAEDTFRIGNEKWVVTGKIPCAMSREDFKAMAGSEVMVNGEPRICTGRFEGSGSV